MDGTIDSHAHLDHEDLAGEVEAVVQRARAAGVVQIVTVASSLSSARACVALAERHAELFATAGIHPHDAAAAQPADLPAIEELAAHPRVVAIGETGLDYHYDFSPRPRQRESFARCAELARRCGRPLVIHIREAHADAVAVLREVYGPSGPVAGVVHCFSGTMPEARVYIELGLHLSFSGIVTFPKAREIQDVASWAPAERILVETDAPYLAPAPHRGRRNEPAYVVHTARFVAELRGLPADDLAELAANNTRRLFRMPAA
jgi:TatD DNase family protein